MQSLRRHFRQVWAQPKSYRALLIAAAVYALLRLAMHIVFLVGILVSGQTEGYDLQVYLDAADRLLHHQPLYPTVALDKIEFYQYAPTYALAFVPFLRVPLAVSMAFFSLLHLLAYSLLYVWWGRIFRRLGLTGAEQTRIRLLPLWLVFSAFWTDLGYLNVYILMALLATLLIDAVLRERLGLAVLWFSIIVQVKPQWAFAAAVPLFLGRRRFFLRLGAVAAAVYAAMGASTALAVGPAYIWQQYAAYFRLLFGLLRQNYLWRTMADGFLGYNHSITQIVVYFWGRSPRTLTLAQVLKVLILTPLALLLLRRLYRSVRGRGTRSRLLALDLAFVLYLSLFIWMDVVWELTLGIALFTYLMATLRHQWSRMLAGIAFLPYALLDLWRVLSFALLGPNAMAPGPYFVTDPSVYLPMTMIPILVFYALLVRRLWSLAPIRLAHHGGNR